MYALSEQATGDPELILEESASVWGPEVARRTFGRLKRQLERIGSGAAVGHARSDIPPDVPVRFVTEWPFVIAFEPATRTIVRILHGRRDFARIFAP